MAIVIFFEEDALAIVAVDIFFLVFTFVGQMVGH